MPELPEVERTAQLLTRWLRGSRVQRVEIEDAKLLPRKSAAELVGESVLRVERRGKWLRILFERGPALYVHLGMSGRWDEGEAVERGERARIVVTNAKRGHVARFIDPRRFGRWVLREEAFADWEKLGPDALDDAPSGKVLEAIFARDRRPIKVALLDQEKLAGLGNIQVTESLWRAKIHPAIRTASLDGKRWQALARSIASTLRRTLADLKRDGVHLLSEGAPNRFMVYGHGGSPCPRCRTTLVRSALGGRGTVWCPHCQT